MPILKRTFSEMNPVKIGIAGIAGLVAIALVALNSGTIIRHFTTTAYQADFSEAGGLTAGDNVDIAGLTMGTVDSVSLQGSHVLVTFSVRHGGDLGEDTGATIASATILGTKELDLEPSGPGTLSAGATIPLSRTTSPYNLEEVLSTLTTKASAINASQVAGAFNTIADTLRTTPPSLRAALSGVERLSETIASRDGALTQLLSNSSTVTGLLAQRSQQIGILITDGNELLSTLYERRDEIHDLLVDVTEVVDQVKGLALDNQNQLGPALHQLQGVLNLLNANATNITETIDGLQRYSNGLGEIIGSGPWFYAYVENIVPTNLAPLLPSLLGK
jgi:phospholipid/cholesterol/gamma-HCH transport system substrate-binding protein